MPKDGAFYSNNEVTVHTSSLVLCCLVQLSWRLTPPLISTFRTIPTCFSLCFNTRFLGILFNAPHLCMLLRAFVLVLTVCNFLIGTNANANAMQCKCKEGFLSAIGLPGTETVSKSRRGKWSPLNFIFFTWLRVRWGLYSWPAFPHWRPAFPGGPAEGSQYHKPPASGGR